MGRIVGALKNLFLATNLETKQFKQAVYAITHLHPSNLSLYKLALQHSSIKDDTASNERLEFLGDAVLSLIIGEYLFKKYPRKAEGFLTDIRARLVNRASLSALAQKIGIDKLLQYDTNALKGSRCKFIYGNALEALIGAVYLDQGYERCCQFVINQLLKIHIDLITLIQNDTNYKSKLVTWGQKKHKTVQFEMVDEKRVNNVKNFTVRVAIEGHVAGHGQGNSKKQAEQMAAQEALQDLPIAD